MSDKTPESHLTQLVVELLQRLGWNKSDIRREPLVQTEGHKLHPDLILLDQMYPLAVVEVKATWPPDELPLRGANQVRMYAQALGIPFALLTNAATVFSVNVADGT